MSEQHRQQNSLSPAAQSLGPYLCFLSHTSFTKVQEAVVPSIFHDGANCLVAAPTGSGKTVLLEVAMLRLFKDALRPTASMGNPAQNNIDDRDGAKKAQWLPSAVAAAHCKAVYICPIKALAYEKYGQWKTQFPSLSVVLETGDNDHVRGAEENLSAVSAAQILVTTPERWDSITRRWKEHHVMNIVNSVGLLLLDEVHTVQEERGAAMEAIVSRLKAIQAAAALARTSSGSVADGTSDNQKSAAVTRVVAISGTLPNARDIAEWLQVPPRMRFSFSSSDRPVPLTVKVLGFPHDSSNPFALDRFLSFKLFSLIRHHSEGRPTLVFCASRKEASSSAQRIADDIKEAAAQQQRTEQLEPSEAVLELANRTTDKHLRSCLLVGVAYHHAALAAGDRRLVESMFKDQYIAVLCTTTTLALGVNLPAHLVIVKGTTFFKGGQREDLPLSEVAQMCGRAGRPGMDTHGLALILTTQRKAWQYDALRQGDAVMTTVESHLHRHMIEHVNAEVALRTIHSFASAMEWVKTTFFWIRLQACPRHYGLQFVNKDDEAAFCADAFVASLMERVLQALVAEGCITLQGSCDYPLLLARTAATAVVAGKEERGSLYHDGGVIPPSADPSACVSSAANVRHSTASFESTRRGRSMAKLYILFDTVKTLNCLTAERRGAVQTMSIEVSEETQVAGEDAVDAEMSEDAHLSKNSSTLADDKTSYTAGKLHRSRSFSLPSVLELLCNCQELVEVRLRQGDRGPLNTLNRQIKYPLKSGRRGGREVRSDWQKAFVLVQAHLGGLPMTEVTLRNDLLRLCSVLPRLSRFLEEYASTHGSYSLVHCTNLLHRCVERRVWPDGLVLRQLEGVSDSIAKCLWRSNLKNFKELMVADARQVEAICSRLPPFGTLLKQQVERLPGVTVAVRAAANKEVSSCSTPEYMKCEVSLFLSFADPNAADSSEATTGRHAKCTSVAARFDDLGARQAMLLVGDSLSDTIVLRRFLDLKSLATSSLSGEKVGMSRPAAEVGPQHRSVTLSYPFTFPLSSLGGSTLEVRVCFTHLVGNDALLIKRGNQLAALVSEPTPTAPQPRHCTAYPHESPAGRAVLCLPPPPQQSTEPEEEGMFAAAVAEEARETFDALMKDVQWIEGDEAECRAPSSQKSTCQGEVSHSGTEWKSLWTSDTAVTAVPFYPDAETPPSNPAQLEQMPIEEKPLVRSAATPPPKRKRQEVFTAGTARHPPYEGSSLKDAAGSWDGAGAVVLRHCQSPDAVRPSAGLEAPPSPAAWRAAPERCAGEVRVPCKHQLPPPYRCVEGYRVPAAQLPPRCQASTWGGHVVSWSTPEGVSPLPGAVQSTYRAATWRNPVESTTSSMLHLMPPFRGPPSTELPEPYGNRNASDQTNLARSAVLHQYGELQFQNRVTPAFVGRGSREEYCPAPSISASCLPRHNSLWVASSPNWCHSEARLPQYTAERFEAGRPRGVNATPFIATPHCHTPDVLREESTSGYLQRPNTGAPNRRYQRFFQVPTGPLYGQYLSHTQPAPMVPRSWW